MSARALVHTYVSALRRALDVPGAPHIETRPGGYRLDCDPQVVDVHRLLDSAGSDDPGTWEAALNFSTQPLLGGVELSFIEAWQIRVDAVRDTLRDRVWARRLGDRRAAEVLAELRAAVEHDPLREDRVLLFARALGQIGRIDEALRALDGYRRRLGEQLGMDPSPAVPALRQDLLTGPQSLPPSDSAPTAVRAPEPSAAIPPRPTRRPPIMTVVATVAATVAAAVAVIALLVWGWPGNPTSDPVGDLAGPALLTVDPTSGSVVDSVTLPISPAQIEASGEMVWVRSEIDQAVAVLDRGGHDAAKVAGLSAPPSAMAVEQDAAIVGLGFSGRR